MLDVFATRGRRRGGGGLSRGRVTGACPYPAARRRLFGFYSRNRHTQAAGALQPAWVWSIVDGTGAVRVSLRGKQDAILPKDRGRKRPAH